MPWNGEQEKRSMPGEKDRETEAYLARIRKTIADGERIISQAELRIAETDRMLEKQGLTREQVLAMRFSDAQMEAANEELKRRGLDPLEKWEAGGYERRETADAPRASHLAAEDYAPDAELAERQRKFGMMMKPFQI